jgi:hypothetical protein
MYEGTGSAVSWAAWASNMALVRNIESLGTYHEALLVKQVANNRFRSTSKVTKALWDHMQNVCPKTLSSNVIAKAQKSCYTKGSAISAQYGLHPGSWPKVDRSDK